MREVDLTGQIGSLTSDHAPGRVSPYTGPEQLIAHNLLKFSRLLPRSKSSVFSLV